MPISPSMSKSQNPPFEVAESRLTAALYNPFMWLGERLGMATRRRELLAEARGAVLAKVVQHIRERVSHAARRGQGAGEEATGPDFTAAQCEPVYRARDANCQPLHAA